MLLGTTVTKELQKDACKALQQAFESGDEKQIQDAWEKFHQSVAESVKQDYVEADGDSKVLAARGYRQLTAKEKQFYEGVIQSAKSKAPQQALTSLIDNNAMPTTVIEDVYKNLTEEHPLLNKVSFTNVLYMTRLIMNDHSVQKAAWGKITAEITQEIDSSFKVLELAQCKLTAYAVIEHGMLDLGPVYLDNYVRTVLKEALASALEAAVISGTGHEMPIGLDRDIHDGVNVSSTEGYPAKEAVKITSFLPEEYGKVVAKLAVTEKGRMRSFDEVTLVCNQVDYLTKVMPATTVMTAAGLYAQNVFPFPTDVCRSNAVDTGKAILFLPEEYFIGIGSSKDGNIEFSDDFKFLEDLRTLKIKMYAMGRAFDNTVAIVLDISELNPAYITVLQKNAGVSSDAKEPETV